LYLSCTVWLDTCRIFFCLFKNCVHVLKIVLCIDRVLEEICRGGGGSAAGQEFLGRALPQLRGLLVTALSSTSPSSQAPRLRCLLSIITQLQVE
jgi:hypothetical protein